MLRITREQVTWLVQLVPVEWTTTAAMGRIMLSVDCLAEAAFQLDRDTKLTDGQS